MRNQKENMRYSNIVNINEDKYKRRKICYTYPNIKKITGVLSYDEKSRISFWSKFCPKKKDFLFFVVFDRKKTKNMK